MDNKHVFIVFFLTTSLIFAGADWQNSVDYKIKVKLDDEKHILFGEEILIYFNNSPTPLSRIWLLLYPNAYKDETTAFAKQGKRNFSTI
ncbi:MAG: M1 family peptidase, partial [Candidatus Marinimicrobia bacterium]|nr:M1 family peptidase [Candidatus Neomarinimicrobiota bacterium]